MSEKIPVPTAECMGMDVTSGGKVVASYDAHNGFVETDNPVHARALRRMSGSRKFTGFANSPLPSAVCAGGCGVEFFEFQLEQGKCRRCRDGQQ